MIDFQTFSAFIASSLILNITPGPDMLFVLTNGTKYGAKSALFSSLGVSIGYMGHILAAAIGLSAILASSAIAFTVIKVVGALYLIYLGIKALFFSKPIEIEETSTYDDPRKSKMVVQGIIVSLFNPKVAIFFLAFLPQFINSNAKSVPLMILTLGIVFSISATAINSLVGIGSGQIGSFFRKNKSASLILDRIAGTVFLGLGFRLAFLDRTK